MLPMNKFAGLFVITLLAVIAAVLTNNKHTPVASLEKENLFSDLKDRVNDVSRIKIQQNSDSIRLVREDTGWIVEEADNYPASFGKIRQILIGLADLKIEAAKTKNPEHFASLGVEDPEAEDSNSTLVTVIDSTNSVLVALIVGDTRKSSSATTHPGLYVRLPEQQQALLVNGVLEVSTAISDWIDADLLNIDPARIRQVDITHADGTHIQLIRNADEEDFRFQDVPDGKEIISAYTLNRQKDMLSSISIEGVQSDAGFDFSHETVATEVMTYDGLQVSIMSTTLDDKHYSTFRFSHVPVVNEQEGDASELSPVESEVNTLNEKTSGWLYEIPAYQYDLFARSPDDLLNDIESGDEGEEAPQE